jgi:hypothetical protein
LPFNSVIVISNDNNFLKAVVVGLLINVPSNVCSLIVIEIAVFVSVISTEVLSEEVEFASM